MNDLNIVLDIHSGSVHIVDDLVYEMIEALKDRDIEDVKAHMQTKYSTSEIEEAASEINTLIENRLLFTDDSYEKVVSAFKNRNPVVKALCLHIAHDCNLACRYCFAGEGEYHGKREMMPLEIGKKAVDFLIAKSGSRKQLEIDFFGGEPLMNFDVVKEIVLYAKEREVETGKKFRFTITTNGILLNDDNMAFINEHMYNVVLSIDGRESVHDYMRPTSNGKGSYQHVLPKFIEMANSREGKSYYVRGTFTSHNLDFSKDVLHLVDLGFDQISVEPVVAPDEADYSITKENLPVIFKEYEELTNQMLDYRKQGKPFNFFHFNIDLTGGPCIYKRTTGCGAGCEYLAVSPGGELYPCHQFVGINEFKLGSLDEGIIKNEIVERFQNTHVYTKDTCKNCWAKFYCGGGCNANAYQFHGDLHTVYETGCEMEKKRVECAIYLKAKERMES